MFTTSRRRTLTVTVFAFALVAFAVIASAEHSWGSYHWARTTQEVTLKVGDNVNDVWQPYFEEAIGDWNPSAYVELVPVAGGTAPKSCRPTSGRIEVCNARYGNTGWLGIAQIWASGSHITQAVAKMNDTYFDTATYNTPAWRRLVMCQEIAHDFGLGHQDETFDNPNLGSCMDYTNDPDGGSGGAVNNDPSNEHPNQHDFDQLQTIYGGHRDSTTTAGQTTNRMPPAANNMDLEGPGQWGREIRRSPGRGISVYEQDFGNGHRVFTVVTWTLEAIRGHGHDDH